ncbi:MAG: type II toxin-antitoxin system YafQ family toxin [Defluviitaleaceae bacterium]|nr:type II toxin-antitoxin system YafQ family toxin [Defluviitaleaceae bacterium]
MYTIKPTSKFQKDVKRVEKRGYNLSLLTEVVALLAKGEILPEKYLDHPLKGNFKDCRECHITPDWLLIYRKNENTLFLYLTRTGTHSDLF